MKFRTGFFRCVHATCAEFSCFFSPLPNILHEFLQELLFFRPTFAQYISGNVYFVKNSYVFRSIYIIFRESFLMYAKVTKSIKLGKLKFFTVVIVTDNQ